MSLLSQAVQPALLTLFSSTSSHPLLLAETAHSQSNSHSLISLIPDCALLPGSGVSSATLLSDTADAEYVDGSPGAALRSQVLHLQDTDVRNTFVRLGGGKGKGKGREVLGVECEWCHFALRTLGGRELYLELDVRDNKGATLVIRCSTFKTSPTAHAPTQSHPALLHLPLSFPSPSTSTSPLLTSWCTLSLHLPTLLASYHSLPLAPPRAGDPQRQPQQRLQPGAFKALDRVEVHANCRLRRVWCSMDGREGVVDEGRVVRGMRTELALFRAEDS